MANVVIGSLQIRLSAATAQFNANLQAARKGLQRFRKSGHEVATGGIALASFSRSLLSVGRAAGEAAGTLNRGMANVATLIPGSTARVEELKTAVQDLAVSHGRQTQDLVGGLYQTISAFGDRAGRTMEVLRINSEAATAGVATTEEAIALTSAITKAYGDTSAAAVRHAADLALTTVRLGQTDFPSLAAAIGRTTPAAAKLGVTQEELSAGFATLTGVTGSTAEVSTQLAAVLQGLIRPTTGMREAVAALGAADAETLVRTHGLAGALEALVGTTDGSNEAVARLVGSQRGLDAIFALTGASATTYAANLTEMGQASGAVLTAVRVQTEGVNAAGHQWDQLLATVRRTQEDLGAVLIPILLRAAEGLRPLVDLAVSAVTAFGRWPQGLQTTVAAVAAVMAGSSLAALAVGGFVASMSPLIRVLASAMSAIRGFLVPLKLTSPASAQAAGAVRAVGPAATVATGGLRTLGVAMRGLAAATGIGVVVVALGMAATALYRWWQAARDPDRRLPRLRDRLAEVNGRIAELEAAGRRVDPRLRATASRLAHQTRQAAAAAEETKRLELASSDLGKALEALAARDMAAWSRASEEAQQRARDLAGDLPAAEQEMATLALAVREFAREGKLTPAVMREIASRVRALGVDAADLPPELRNIVTALDRVEQSSEDAAGAAGGLGEGLGAAGDAAGETAQSLRQLVAAEIEAIRAAERHAEVRRAAVAALHDERVAAGLAWLAGQPSLPVSTGPLPQIVGGGGGPEMPAWLAGIAGGSAGGVIEIEIRPEYSSGPPPPPPPAWIGRGWTVRELLDQYPGVEEADVLACIAYGAEMSRERYVDVPLEASS